MKPILLLSLGLVFALILSACATQPVLAPVESGRTLAALDDWQMRGRIVVRNATDAEKAKFTWRQSAQDYKIRLSGSLGMGTTYIHGSPGEVRLEQSGKQPITAATPEQLVWDQLGQEIPISQLHYWVRGIPDPSSPSSHQTNPTGDGLAHLEQAGWSLNYGSYSQIGAWHLPNEMVAIRNDIELTISIDQWTLPDTQPHTQPDTQPNTQPHTQPDTRQE